VTETDVVVEPGAARAVARGGGGPRSRLRLRGGGFESVSRPIINFGD
jgi:hypothetical protein